MALPVALTACISGDDIASPSVVIRIERVVLLQDAALSFCIDIRPIEADLGSVDVFPPGDPSKVVVVVVVVVAVAVTVEEVVMVDVTVTMLVIPVVMVTVLVTVADVNNVAVETTVDVTVDAGCPVLVAKVWVITGWTSAVNPADIMAITIIANSAALLSSSIA